jgi:methylmalonyl-CoA/ethylmalonyl-CoA epimerase
MEHFGWRFHHVGIATRSIEPFINRFADISECVSAEFSDSNQGVRGKFIQIGDLSMEVLEPLEGDLILEPWITNGNRAYQIAFEVNDLDNEIAVARKNKIRIVREPHPAVAFNGRRVAFLMPVSGLLVELIESSAH